VIDPIEIDAEEVATRRRKREKTVRTMNWDHPYLPFFYEPQVSQWVKERFERGDTIELDEWEHYRMNSYERQYLLPLFSDEVLCWMVDYARENASQIHGGHGVIPGNYDEAIIHLYSKELVERLRERGLS
jgi:hypothetical protein